MQSYSVDKLTLNPIKKGLILDGQHRASAITIVCEKGVSMPEVRVLECYGSAVSVIFVRYLPALRQVNCNSCLVPLNEF